MVQKINFRFNGTQAQFYSTSSYIITLVEQNLDLFKKFGTTEDQLNEAKKCLQKYDTATPDMAMRLNQANISVNKNKLVENLKNELRYVNAFLKVNLTLSPQNDFYVLNIKELSRLRSKEISNNTKKLMQSIENYNNSIENYELIQDNISTINDLYKQIRDIDDKHTDSQHNRKIQTNHRNNLASELFNYIYKFSTIGKALFENVDKAMAQRFNLYKNTTKNTEPQTINEEKTQS